ncbi:hypothetical protein D3C74_375670 [compost metagenome]
MPAFAAKYGARNGGCPPRVELEPIQITRPLRCARMMGSTARLTRWVETTFTSYWAAICSGVNASAGPSTICPALWISTSMRWRCPWMSATAASMEAWSWTSISMPWMLRPSEAASWSSCAALSALRPVMARMPA